MFLEKKKSSYLCLQVIASDDCENYNIVFKRNEKFVVFRKDTNIAFAT